MNQLSGINAIIFYANQLFNTISNGDDDEAVKLSFELGIFQIVITVISGLMLDKFGRKTLMVVGNCIIVMSLFAGFITDSVIGGV